jgi:hypothetical protein
MPDLNLAKPYADASREVLLALLDDLLDEQASYAAQIATLNIEVVTQRIASWNSGFEWGWRSCLREIQRRTK